MQSPPTTNSTPATLYRRGFAYIIDALLIGLGTAIAWYFLIEQRDLTLATCALILKGAYKPIMEARFGWTLGKVSQKIRVIDAVTGRKPDLNQSLMRYLPWAMGVFAEIFVLVRIFQTPDFADVTELAQYVEVVQASPLSDNLLLQVIGNLPIFSAAWLITDLRRQALHDKIAKTLVITMPEPLVEA